MVHVTIFSLHSAYHAVIKQLYKEEIPLFFSIMLSTLSFLRKLFLKSWLRFFLKICVLGNGRSVIPVVNEFFKCVKYLNLLSEPSLD
jgi:hypothetical protein